MTEPPRRTPEQCARYGWYRDPARTNKSLRASGLEELRAMKDGNRLTDMEQTLGMRIVAEVEDGRVVVVEGTPGFHLYNPIGTVHGGYAATLLDNACGYAVQSKMMPGQVFTALELKVAFHKAIIGTLDRRALWNEAIEVNRTALEIDRQVRDR